MDWENCSEPGNEANGSLDENQKLGTINGTSASAPLLRKKPNPISIIKIPPPESSPSSPSSSSLAPPPSSSSPNNLLHQSSSYSSSPFFGALPSPSFSASPSPSAFFSASPIWRHLEEIFELCKEIKKGSVASYIPELAKANGDLFSACLVSADGFIYELGDSEHGFTIQSISKPFVYGLALVDHGIDEVNKKVGVKPSGDSFNSIIFDENNQRPFNPMVNAGAIATTSLIKGTGVDERFNRILSLFEGFAGTKLSVDEAVFESERSTGHRNRAIAHLELSNGMIEGNIDEHLDVYFKQCAIQITAKDLAVMAATLANKGRNPITGQSVIDTPEVTSILSVMTSCGMYDFSGDWLYNVGIPAKSGVAGGIIAVLPGQFGIGVFSPLLDRYGNSVRGIRFCEELSKRFNLHTFNLHPLSSLCVDKMYTAATVSSRSQRRAEERKILDKKGQLVIVKELKGDLFFASMDRLIRNLAAERFAEYMILDWSRVGRVDKTALNLLVDLGCWYTEKQTKMMISGMPESVKSRLETMGWSQTNTFYGTLDEALEFCEETILYKERGERGSAEELTLGCMDFFKKFSTDEVQIIEELIERTEFKGGEMIITKGDDSDSVFFLAKEPRLVTYIPGVSFGDMALFDMGQRTANVMADYPGVVCLVLKIEKLNQILETNPKIYSKILKEAGRSIALLLKRKN